MINLYLLSIKKNTFVSKIEIYPSYNAPNHVLRCEKRSLTEEVRLFRIGNNDTIMQQIIGLP